MVILLMDVGVRALTGTQSYLRFIDSTRGLKGVGLVIVRFLIAGVGANGSTALPWVGDWRGELVWLTVSGGSVMRTSSIMCVFIEQQG